MPLLQQSPIIHLSLELVYVDVRKSWLFRICLWKLLQTLNTEKVFTVSFVEYIVEEFNLLWMEV